MRESFYQFCCCMAALQCYIPDRGVSPGHGQPLQHRLHTVLPQQQLHGVLRQPSMSESMYIICPHLHQLTLHRWVQKEARPISLRQLTFFGRTLTENRLLSSANYVRTELPTRLAHRLRDMQTLPFVVVTNPHMSHVYELYYKAFEKLRKIREIKTAEENEQYCKMISETLQEHLTVIPRLAMGVLECQDLMRPEEIDKFMNTLLRSVRLF